MGATHARTVEQSFERADERMFAVGNAHDHVRSDMEGERNSTWGNAVARIEQPQKASIEVQYYVKTPDYGINSGRRRQYAELGRLSPADELAVEQTTHILSNVLLKVNQTLSRRPDLITANSYGIAVHTEFAAAVRALNLPGIGTVGVEQSFHPLGPARYGKRGSIRTDIILRNGEGVIIAIFDVKTGDAEMRPSTEQRYREYTRVSPYVQLIILRARRGER